MFFSTPVRWQPPDRSDDESDDGYGGSAAWQLKMLLDTEAGLGWLALCDAWELSSLAARQIWAAVHGRRDMDAAEDNDEGGGDKSRASRRRAGSHDAAEGFALAQFLEAVVWAAALANPYGRPPYNGARFEKMLRAWLDGTLVAHARKEQLKATDVIASLTRQATHDMHASAAMDELRHTHLVRLFERFSDGAPRGVSLSGFVELAEELWPTLPTASVARYHQVAEAAFVRALPMASLHAHASAIGDADRDDKGKRQEAEEVGPALLRLRLPTFEEAALRLAFVHAHLSASAEANSAGIGGAPLVEARWLSRPLWLSVSHAEAMCTLMERALPGTPRRTSSTNPFVPPLLALSPHGSTFRGSQPVLASPVPTLASLGFSWTPPQGASLSPSARQMPPARTPRSARGTTSPPPPRGSQSARDSRPSRSATVSL